MLRIHQICVLAALAAGLAIHPAQASDAPSTAAFKKAIAIMHHGMAIDYTGDADIDFVRDMIPHHQGAINMAQTLLQYGKDPEVQKLARSVIAAQTAEIKQMQQWLDTHPQVASSRQQPSSYADSVQKHPVGR